MTIEPPFKFNSVLGNSAFSCGGDQFIGVKLPSMGCEKGEQTTERAFNGCPGLNPEKYPM